MKAFTTQRGAATPDEIWLLEHFPVFTQGLAGKAEHVLNPHNIPIVQTDRGGQVTYHGPGQLMAYLLLDNKRLGLLTRAFVRTIEQIIIDYLNYSEYLEFEEFKESIDFYRRLPIQEITLMIPSKRSEF